MKNVAKLAKADSVTHEHILAIINTESYRFGRNSTIRLLDAGCGNGRLIAYLQNNLSKLIPDLSYEIYGFDVCDHGVQQDDFLKHTVHDLSEHFPEIAWSKRIVSIAAEEKWPYPNDYFDIIISNQVLEHVMDHDLFFTQIHRTMNKIGFSIHVFPLRHYLFETHLNLPWVHRIYNYDYLKAYIKTLSRLGLGKFKSVHRSTGTSCEDYSEKHADYLNYFTNYLSYKDFLKLGKKHKLRISFRHTKEYYVNKIRSLLGMCPKFIYSKKDQARILDWFYLFILRYVSSVTLFLEKKETYTLK